MMDWGAQVAHEQRVARQALSLSRLPENRYFEAARPSSHGRDSSFSFVSQRYWLAARRDGTPSPEEASLVLSR